MKEYSVSVDITMACTIYVEAENEEQAQNKAQEIVENDPYYYGRKGNYLGYVVVGADEV